MTATVLNAMTTKYLKGVINFVAALPLRKICVNEFLSIRFLRGIKFLDSTPDDFGEASKHYMPNPAMQSVCLFCHVTKNGVTNVSRLLEAKCFELCPKPILLLLDN